MAFELIIVLCVGFATAGVVMLVSRPFGLKLGKTVVPLAAALAMLGYQVWNRYTWADRMAGRLPEDSVVITRIQKTSLLEPWSFARPMTGALLVLDRKSAMTHPKYPGMILVETRLLEPYKETLASYHLLDCAKGRRVVVGSPQDIEAGLPDAWIEGRNPAAMFDAVCGKGP